ncbi:MAG: hypothetical protein IT200_13195 [Thermoleophilia bacterium]|nr:hypothetical protein [Thermoleophilia bacterium]
MDPESRGDPVLPLRWTAKSVRNLADALAGLYQRVGAPRDLVRRRETSAAPSGTRRTPRDVTVGGWVPVDDAEIDDESGDPVMRVVGEVDGAWPREGCDRQDRPRRPVVDEHRFTAVNVLDAVPVMVEVREGLGCPDADATVVGVEDAALVVPAGGQHPPAGDRRVGDQRDIDRGVERFADQGMGGGHHPHRCGGRHGGGLGVCDGVGVIVGIAYADVPAGQVKVPDVDDLADAPWHRAVGPLGARQVRVAEQTRQRRVDAPVPESHLDEPSPVAGWTGDLQQVPQAPRLTLVLRRPPVQPGVPVRVVGEVGPQVLGDIADQPVVHRRSVHACHVHLGGRAGDRRGGLRR